MSAPNEALLAISHVTEYRYSARVELGQHVAHLTPRQDEHQSIEQCELRIEPSPSDLRSGTDTFGNVRSMFSIFSAHESLKVTAASRVRIRDRHWSLDPADSQPWESVRETLQYRAGRPYSSASEFVFASPYVPRDPALARYAMASFRAGRRLTDAAADLMHRVHSDFRYAPASTDVSTPVLEAFRQRTGVCQDFSHVMIGCLRSIGLAARYVSGYLVATSEGKRSDDATPAASAEHPRDETSGNSKVRRPIGADASHAWVSVFCPKQGWVDLDPTNDLLPRRHVVVAIGRDYGDVAPLRGVIRGGAEHELSVAVRVAPCNNGAQPKGDGAAGTPGG